MVLGGCNGDVAENVERIPGNAEYTLHSFVLAVRCKKKNVLT